ncbi:tripartite tricarboxylate transporter substrate binding protein [Neobacillus sp. KR4-4]|uniref:tripartite tricarboxylate transporter substrate binding protein n=1 Tax=Neobacillus sp. KR4-4 TaxID=3344872 RepID=UPI0035C96E79
MKKFVMLFLSALLIVLAGCSDSSKSTGSNAVTAANNEKQTKIEYPKRPIEVLVPFAAGGSTDIGARILEKYLPKYLPNAQLVIVNKPGGSGSIAITDLFNSKPDGYTIAMSTHRAISMQPLYGNVKYSYDSFQPISKVFGNQQIMIVKADAPWKTFEEWLDYVKKNPGKFSYGVAGGIGSGAHLPMAELEKMAHLNAKAVSFEGTPPAITGVLGGHVQGAMVQPSDAKALIESGELRAIFNAASVPVPYFPDIPLLKDKGFDIAIDSNTSLFAPKGVPKEIITMLEEAVKKTMEDPEVLKEFEHASLQTQYGSPEVVQKEVDGENVRFGKMLKELGLIK